MGKPPPELVPRADRDELRGEIRSAISFALAGPNVWPIAKAADDVLDLLASRGLVGTEEK